MLQQRVNLILQMSDTQFLACNTVTQSSDMDIHIVIFLLKKIHRAIPGLIKSLMETIGSGLYR